MHISKCIGCTISKDKNSHKFPLYCKSAKHVCFALKSEPLKNANKCIDLINNHNSGLLSTETDYIDENFIKAMYQYEKEVLKQGLTIEYKEES